VSAPELAEAWRLHRAGEHDRAERLYRDILRTDPSNYEALHRLAFLNGQCGRWEQAQELMARAIALNPYAADALFLRGAALQQLHRHEDAVSCFDRALALNPSLAEARLNRAASLYRLRRYEEAGEDYSRLLQIDPDYPFARGNRLFCRLQCCDWRSFEEEGAAIETALRAGKRVITSFDAKALFLTAEDELMCARIWAADQHRGALPPLSLRPRSQNSIIRVAYVSADFRAGPVATLMAGVFERHDRERFETVGVSLAPDDGSATRARLKQAFRRFIDASAMSDADTAAKLRDMEIDIAVDLMGFTEGARPEIFRHRPAPIQVNYLGFPGTIGADWLDYLIAEDVIVPEEHRRFHAEHIVYLPHSYVTRDTSRKVSAVTVARAEERAGESLPQNGLVFACFNNTYKINPRMFDIWMRLLRAVDGSVLWLPQSNRAAMHNLAREAAERNISPDRLVFASFRPSLEQHLARLALADLFLDTLPYNAHTTCSDALWAGVPLLTCLGATFAGRVAASLLYSLDLPELVTDTLAGYERMALKLARDADALGRMREKLQRNRATHSLFDEEGFTRDLERAYLIMWECHQRGEPPASFRVPAT
jgi:predicted O-linked N-acetylglucosamine transferase (SPINDLY family)